MTGADREWITLEEASGLTRRSVRSLEAWIASGGIRQQRDGRVLREDVVTMQGIASALTGPRTPAQTSFVDRIMDQAWERLAPERAAWLGEF